MLTSWFKKIWLVMSVILSIWLAYLAFKSPIRFVPLADLLATIISILIGVSLAISAVLSSPPKVSQTGYNTVDERNRAQNKVDGDYKLRLSGQNFLFQVYYASLILAVLLKFIFIYFGYGEKPPTTISVWFKVIASIFALVTSFALLCSALLPSILHDINTHKASQ